MLSQETAVGAADTRDPFAQRAAHLAQAQQGLAAHVVARVVQRTSGQAALPAAYVSAAALQRLAGHDLAGIGCALNELPGAGLVAIYTAPPASSDLLAAVKAYARGYLLEERDEPALCADAAHHKAVCDLFAAIDHEERRVAA